MTAIVKPVIMTNLSGRLEGAVKVAPDKRFGVVPLNAQHHLDAVEGEDVGGAWTHPTGQDHRRTLFPQPHGIHSATMFGWSAESAFVDGATRVIHGVEGECLGAAEVLTKPAFVQWNCDLH
jgi:hypothetical protein